VCSVSVMGVLSMSSGGMIIDISMCLFMWVLNSMWL